MVEVKVADHESTKRPEERCCKIWSFNKFFEKKGALLNLGYLSVNRVPPDNFQHLRCAEKYFHY